MERELEGGKIAKVREDSLIFTFWGFPGDASRVCGDGGVWEDPDVSNCSLRVFTMPLVSVSS